MKTFFRPEYLCGTRRVPASLLISFLIVFFLVRFSNLAPAQVNLDSLWTIYQDSQNGDSVRLQAISDFIENGYLMSQPDSALHYIQIQYDYADRIGSTYWKALAIGSKGVAYLVQNNLEKAEQFAQEAYDLAQANNDKENMAYNLTNLGLVEQKRSNTVKELDYYTRSLKLYEAGKRTKKNIIGEASALVNIGIIYSNQGESEKALQSYQKALPLHESVNNERGMANTISNIGAVKFTNGEFEEAMPYYERAYQLHLKVGNRYNSVVTLSNMAHIYSSRGQFEKAHAALKECLDFGESLGNKRMTAHFTFSIGVTYFEQKKYKEALSYLKKSLALGKEMENLIAIDAAANMMYEVYRETGNYKAALEYHELHITTLDSIKSETNQRELLRQEYQYNYEKTALADSLEFAKIQAIKDLEIEQQEATLGLQRVALLSSILGLLLLLALVYSFFKSRKQARAEADRIKELDQFKTRLYTNITHEFRTPLTVILGMADQIESQPKAYLEEGIELIKRNGKNLLRLINQLLDLSKLENKSFQLQTQQGDIIPYLQYLTESFHSYANGKNLSLRFFSNVESLWMDYDAEQIKQVMSNLISNAIKFTPSDGEVLIRVNRKGKNLSVEVKDTGIGIAPKNQAQVFDRFFQIENPNSQVGEGTGIGLAHTKELVELMKGKIRVESTENQGTSFFITLPIANESLGATPAVAKTAKPPVLAKEEVLTEKEASSANSNAAMSNTGSNLPQILIIEDNPDVVTYLRSCLQNQYQIEIAYNGAIGIEKALENIPDLIISDVMMPEKDGFEVCETLKNDDRTSHIPILLLTAKVDVASRLAGLKRGADVYLAKPFDKEELLIRLENLMNLRQRMRTSFTHQLEQQPSLTQAIDAADETIVVEHAFIQKVKNILEANIGDEDFGLPQLCQKIGMSRSQLFRKMKALTDTAPSAFIKNYRLQKAKYLLENTDKNVAEAAYDVGFKDPSYFSKVFQENFGFSPSATNK